MKLDKVCMETREEFSALLDEELTLEERERVESHLSECSECLRELNALKQVDDAYGELPEVMAPKGFEKRVRAATRPRRRIRPILWLGPVLAAAAAVVVVVSGVFEQDANGPERFRTASQADEASSDRKGALLKREAAQSTAAADREVMSADQVERLKSLGYLSDEEGEQLEALGYLGEESKEKKLSSESDAALSAEAAASASRRDVLGEPTDEAQADAPDQLKEQIARSRPAEVRAESFDVSLEDMDQLLEREAPVSRMSLRSFRVRDGVWIEQSYAGEETVALKRGSEELANLLVLDPEVKKIVDRSAACIFIVGDKWYRLESAPELDETL